MTVLVDDPARTLKTQEMSRAGLKADIHSDLAAVEALWRGIEADPAALATPYQRFDWVAAFLAGTFGADEARRAEALRVVVLRDGAGSVRLILPLVCRRERGARVARVVGGSHANYHMPLFPSREAAALDGGDIVEALRGAGVAAGIDAYILGNQPRSWDGAVNPLAGRSEPAASDAYGLRLDPDPEATVRRVFSADARKKLRAKEKKLVEAVGPVVFRQASSPAEAATFLDAFYRQKAVRFAALGVADPYAGEGVRRFLVQAACGQEHRVVEVCALVGVVEGRVYATFAGAVDAVRYSGMMTSFDPDPALARFSPGEILLRHLVSDQAARGRRAFDLGVGEARYKASICDETIELREVAIPVTLRGRIVIAEAVARGRIKRSIKRDPRLLRLVSRLRRRKAPALGAPSP